MTECNQSGFGFAASGKREIVARFDGGTISSDGGAFLLRQTDKRLNLLARLAECFLDGRNQEQVEHSIVEMLSQRIYGLALGYEDINDHEQLRKDPVFGILALVAFYLPSVVFVDLYWRHLPSRRRLSFLAGLAALAFCSYGVAHWLDAKPRAIWEVSPRALSADKGDPAG